MHRGFLCAVIAAFLLGAGQAQGSVVQIPLHGASQINLQVESGGVHLIAAAGAHTITIRSGGKAQPHAEVARMGTSTISIALTGHHAVSLPFAQGTAAPVGYEIVYPAGMRVELYDLSGDITVDNPRSRFAVETNSGSITVNDAHGELDLAADAGSIAVTLAPNWKADSIRMQSGSGTVRLAVPRTFRAHVDAATDEGTVHDSLSRANTHAKRPFVWLYTRSGDVWLTASP